MLAYEFTNQKITSIMKILIKLLTVLCLTFTSQLLLTAQSLTVTELEAQTVITKMGNLKDGSTMPLSWAASSQMACFPATRFNEYQGNHLLYRVQLPAYSKMKITVTPKNKKHRINLYALRLGENNMGTPPELNSAISCEASYPIYAGTPNYRQANKAKSVEYISIRKSYTILIGVAGAVDVKEGDFELKIETSKR